MEHVRYDELLLRLEAGGLTEPETVVRKAIVEDKLPKLMLSFFFNTGQREQGCEFTHKSFREYLVAESDRGVPQAQCGPTRGATAAPRLLAGL